MTASVQRTSNLFPVKREPAASSVKLNETAGSGEESSVSGITGVTSVSPVNFTALSGHKMYAEMQKLSKPDSGEYEGSDGKKKKNRSLGRNVDTYA